MFARITTLGIVALLSISLAARGQMPQHDQTPAPQPVELYAGMGTLHHAIHTSNPETQKYFDQGLTLVYGFNHEQAIRSFEHASELDPNAAMPYWGKALALGPNYNVDIDLDHEKGPYATIQKAKELAAGGPENERDYVNALAKRYSDDPKADLKKLALDYANAMRDLAHKYPNDPDAQVLYAESLMDLHPWQLWSIDGKPNENTLEIIAVLEATLKRWPDHAGANHYYIHAVEASAHPERANASAKRLETAVPAAGHLVHMPAHIYLRTGDYAGSVKSNQEAIASDNSFLQMTGTSNSMYGMMYLGHNVAFLIYAAGMTGQFRVAQDAAEKDAAESLPAVFEIPMAESALPGPILNLVRFAKWDDVLKLAAPDEKLNITTMFWHYARGCAFAAKGQHAEAEKELAAFQANVAKLPPGPAYGIAFNDWSVIAGIAGHTLQARVAWAGVRHAATPAAADAAIGAAIDHWKQAVAIQDKMNYDEPPEWFYPVRESLGAALLRSSKFAEAEAVFREDLKQHPNNPRSLFGLYQSIEEECHNGIGCGVYERGRLQSARDAFEKAWKNADVQLRIEDF
jgi:tetratricopeptide (TPR) repeat protein